MACSERLERRIARLARWVAVVTDTAGEESTARGGIDRDCGSRAGEARWGCGIRQPAFQSRGSSAGERDRGPNDPSGRSGVCRPTPVASSRNPGAQKSTTIPCDVLEVGGSEMQVIWPGFTPNQIALSTSRWSVKSNRAIAPPRPPRTATRWWNLGPHRRALGLIRWAAWGRGFRAAASNESTWTPGGVGFQGFAERHFLLMLIGCSIPSPLENVCVRFLTITCRCGPWGERPRQT